MHTLPRYNLGFIGCGNMNRSIVKSILSFSKVSKDKIFMSNRSSGKLKKTKEELGVKTLTSNESLVNHSDIIFIGVKPQDLGGAIDPIAREFDSRQIVISMVAGVSLCSLRKLLPGPKVIVRIMPNTPLKYQKAVVGYCIEEGEHKETYKPLVEEIISCMGEAVELDEGELFEALTVACGSGVGFIFELMIYWQEWLEEHGFSGEQARDLTVKTFLGTADLANKERELSLQDLQNKVVSKKGVTAAGLKSMGELDVERSLRLSFEKAALRSKDLSGIL